MPVPLPVPGPTVSVPPQAQSVTVPISDTARVRRGPAAFWMETVACIVSPDSLRLQRRVSAVSSSRGRPEGRLLRRRDHEGHRPKCLSVAKYARGIREDKGRHCATLKLTGHAMLPVSQPPSEIDVPLAAAVMVTDRPSTPVTNPLCSLSPTSCCWNSR